MVQVSNSDRGELVSYLVGLKEQPNIKEHLIKVLLAEDENINLDVYDTYELYHFAANLKHKEISDILNPKLDALFKNVPEFFKVAFENRKLYSYIKYERPLSSIKDNILLPMRHKDSGFIQTSDELEEIIPYIRSSVNKEIEMLEIELAFFKLFKSMINPKLARTVVKINNDRRHELLSHLIELQEHDKYNKDLQSSIKMITELNVDTVDVPEFFKVAFENMELYSYLKYERPLSFFEDNILRHIHRNSLGDGKYEDLEEIIPYIRSSVNKEIEMLEIELAFFKLFKSMINPKLARTEDEKHDGYAYLNILVRSKLEFDGKIQSRFRAVQLEENKKLGNDDNNLGIDWNDKGHPNKSNKRFFSGEHPACLSEKEDYNSLNIKIKDENEKNKTLDHFMQEYIKKIKAIHKISEIEQTPEFWNHVFLAEDRKNSNPNNTEHARLKLECRAPKYVKNVYNENFFIRMAFESTNEPNVYKMTKEGREEYHYNVIFHKQSFPDDSYIYAADDVIKVTDISEDTYQHAGACAEIIKQADQKSYLTMTMHLVPIWPPAVAQDRDDCMLIPRSTVSVNDDEDLECDGQSSHSRIDVLSNPDAQGLPEGKLKAKSFKIKSINFDRVSALVRDAQPVESCVKNMQDKMNRMTGKENDLSRTSSSIRPSAPSQ